MHSQYDYKYHKCYGKDKQNFPQKLRKIHSFLQIRIVLYTIHISNPEKLFAAKAKASHPLAKSHKPH